MAPSVAGFTSVPSHCASIQSIPASSPIPRLHVSISAVQVSDNNDDETSRSAPAESSAAKSSASENLDWDWKAAVQEIWKLDHREVILFDGDCNLCNGGVNMLLDMDLNKEFRFCSLSSNFGKSLLVAHGKHPEDRDSIMIVSPLNPKARTVKSKHLEKSEAVMLIASKLEGAPSWVKAMTKVGTVAPKKVSDWFLNIIAENRHRVNLSEEYDQCRLDFDGEYDGRFLNDYEHEHLFEPIDEDKIRKKYSDIMFS